MTSTGSAPFAYRVAGLIAVAGLTVAGSIALADDHGSAAHAPQASSTHATPPAAKPAAKPAEKMGDKPANKIAPPTGPKTTEKPSDKTSEKAGEKGNEKSGSEKAGSEKATSETVNAPTTRAGNSGTSENAAIENTEGLSADEALKLLMEGNARWVASSANTPNTSEERRKSVAEQGQHPFVTVLTCADSRLPVERLFDRGVGDVFVVRVAGNIAGTSETGTIEYGVEHLKTPLLVVMGHSKCGAVSAAATHADVHGAIAKIVDQIEPAVVRASKNNPGVEGADLVPMAVKENVWQSVFDLLKGSHETREMVETGKLRIVGAVCDIATGKVEWMGEHPWQKELITAMKADDKARTPAHADAEAGNAAAGAAQDVAESHH